MVQTPQGEVNVRNPSHVSGNGSPGGEPLVSLRQAGRRAEGRWLVRDVSLSVGEGEIVTLVGPNGSGKSTTARLALGIDAPDMGRVDRRAGLRVAYVPQRLAVNRNLPLSVDRLMRLTGPLSRGEAQAALDRTGVGHLRKAAVHTLSGGELQRVLLARAVARSPQFLVLDEPAQGVDMAGEVALYKLVADIRDELQCGILLVSHDLHLVMADTTRVICLNGHVCCEGSPSSVAQNPQYRHLFGDRAAQALAVYHHQHDHHHLPDGRVLNADGTISDHCHDGHDAESHGEKGREGEAVHAG